MKSKPIVFLSHINEEKEVAIKLKQLLQETFVQLIDVFVSSDEGSNGIGQKWLDNITDSLEKCVIEIILCSKESVKRPWINFEAGAGWIRKIPVIPACHSGIERNKLPVPLSALNAVNINSNEGLTSLLNCLAVEIEAGVPKQNLSEFIDFIHEFEKGYLFWDNFNHGFTKLGLDACGAINGLKEGKTILIDIMMTDVKDMREPINFMKEHNLLDITPHSSTMRADGTIQHYKVEPLSNLQSVLLNPKFRH